MKTIDTYELFRSISCESKVTYPTILMLLYNTNRRHSKPAMRWALFNIFSFQFNHCFRTSLPISAAKLRKILNALGWFFPFFSLLYRKWAVAFPEPSSACPRGRGSSPCGAYLACRSGNVPSECGAGMLPGMHRFREYESGMVLSGFTFVCEVQASMQKATRNKRIFLLIANWSPIGLF